MKTHDLARALSELAGVLKKTPNVEISEWQIPTRPRVTTGFIVDGKFQPERAGSALSLLVGLSKINKQDWIQLIQYYNWPLAIDTRDSSRNIVGKVLNFLQTNPQASARLQNSPPPSGTSPALMKALKALLEDNEPKR
jgi:hypothetical protein